MELLRLVHFIFWCDIGVQASFFSVTHRLYKGFQVDGTVLSQSVIVPEVNTEDAGYTALVRHARILCSRNCLHNEMCWSSFLKQESGDDITYLVCVLIEKNFCQLPKLENVESDALIYDKLLQSDGPKSCMDRCYETSNQSCAACSRPGCTGSDCTNCLTTCKDCMIEKGYSDGNMSDVKLQCSLWPQGPEKLYFPNTICVGEKLLFFERFHYPNGTNVLYDTKMLCSYRQYLLVPTQRFLLVELFALNETTPYYALYSGLKFDWGCKMTLQAYINGTAGDGLGAPLNAVTLNKTADVSCGQFWNLTDPVVIANTPYGTGPCPGGMTAFWGMPTGTTPWQSGITWATLPNHTFAGVQLYVF